MNTRFGWLLLALCMGLHPAWSATFPERPVRMLVGFAAGGITDITARQVAEGMSRALGQPVVVDNRTGAGGNIASAELARAQPDGYTIMLASPGQLVVNPLTQKSLGFDPKTPFTLLSLVNESPFVLVVPANSRFKSVPEMVAWGKTHEAGLSFASPGLGTTMHIAGEMLKVMAGVPAVHVPYRGGAQSTADLVAGRVDFMIDSAGAVAAQVQGGQLRVLAVASGRELPQYPDAPLLSSLYPGLEASSWLGLVGPPGLPEEVQRTLLRAVEQAVSQPQYVQMLTTRGSIPASAGPAAFSALLVKERARVERTVVKAGLRLD
ncbi:tripartite tricarboxylate transporter substrate binding protein [Variovorax sp. J22P271]|uniref:Bug family tripartite tricarboxylate transporter substrate binding protein n=1 Tax=Variovorax davisae TaxID=3053515 RepID=UPI00257636BE|nr:tripartite tricarboxylate transporter substrate binding protein [Variovorax sp. J22P271]MDM0033576.1 tripartite tricarboxylate transporter substrate binding protein [Variovorax sp. J22P271]